MPQIIPIYKNGQQIDSVEFPDGMTDDQMHLAIQKEYGVDQNKVQQEKLKQFSNAIGANRGPFENIRDLVQGALTGMGKGGQAVANIFPGAPNVDIDQAFSSVGTNDKSLQSETLKGIGSYLPYGAVGGMSIPGQMLAGAAHGAGTADKDQQNLLGLLPSGKLGAAIEESGLSALPLTLPKLMKTLFKPVDFTDAAKSVQTGHDILKYTTKKDFGAVTREAKNRGINKIPVNGNFFENIWEQQYLPRTNAVRKLINKAKTGDYEALRQLQSDLGSKGSAGLSSKMMSESNKAAEALEKKDQINDLIYSHFRDLGHNDLADKLMQARNDYRKLMQTYYSHPRIKKLVDSENRLIPKNPANLFSEDSEKMRKVIKQHPEVKAALDEHNNRNKLLRILGVTVGAPTALGLGVEAYRGLKSLFNKQ